MSHYYSPPPNKCLCRDICTYMYLYTHTFASTVPACNDVFGGPFLLAVFVAFPVKYSTVLPSAIPLLLLLLLVRRSLPRVLCLYAFPTSTAFHCLSPYISQSVALLDGLQHVFATVVQKEPQQQYVLCISTIFSDFPPSFCQPP